MHGYVNDQVYGGMTGLITIGSPLDEVPDPTIRRVKQHVLALQAIQVLPGGKANVNQFSPRGEMNLVNGRSEPTMTIHPGETQLWRVGNISVENRYKLELPGWTFHVVGEDGNPKPVLQDEKYLLIPPASGSSSSCSARRQGRTRCAAWRSTRASTTLAASSSRTSCAPARRRPRWPSRT
jgi:suppressor of ftsI